MRSHVLRIVVALLDVAIGWAAASSLVVSSGGRSVHDVTHPCPGVAAVTAEAGAVRVALPSAACAGSTLHITTLTTAGVLVGSGTALVSGGTAVVGVPTTGATDAAATVDGWAPPLTWAGSGPVFPGTPGIALTDVTGTG